MILKNITAIKEITRIGGYPNNHGISYDGLNENMYAEDWSTANHPKLNEIDTNISWTMSTVVTIESQITAQGLYSKYGNPFIGGSLAGYFGFRWFVGPDTAPVLTATFNRGSSQNTKAEGTTQLTYGNRYHLTVTYNGIINGSNTGFKFYINGVLETMVLSGLNNITGILNSNDNSLPIIGSLWNFANYNFFKGTMENMRAWNVEFSQAQINIDYNYSNPTFPIMPDNMLIDINMGDDIDTTSPLVQGDAVNSMKGWQTSNMNNTNIVTL